MKSYSQTAAIHQTGLNTILPDEAVYREQVRLLYKHLPFGFLTVALIAPVFSFIVWDENKPYPVIIWLTLMLLLAGIRFWSGQKFNRVPLEETNIRNWEKYFLAGISLSALLWGTTSLWIDEHSSNLQQLFHIFTLTGLIGGSIAHLSSRPFAFRIFITLILLPYVIRYIVIDTPFHLAIAGLISFILSS